MLEIKNNEKVEFLDVLMEYYTERGFGVVSKRDIDILMMHLMLKHSDLKGLSNHELSLKLKITETKVKNLIHEAKLRFYQFDEEAIKSEFIKVVENSIIEIYDDKITLHIEDTYLRMEIQNRIINLKYNYDNSFNESNLLITSDAFIALLETFYDAKETSKLMKKVKNKDSEIDFKRVLKLFIEEAAKTGAKEGVKIIAGSLVGDVGMSKIYDIIKPIFKFKNMNIEAKELEDINVF